MKEVMKDTSMLTPIEIALGGRRERYDHGNKAL